MEQQHTAPEYGTELIRDQKTCSGAVGTFGSRGSLSDCACGAVAVYNTSLLFGLPASFSQIYQSIGRSWFVKLFRGRLGTAPWTLRRCLKRAGVRAGRFRSWRRARPGHGAYVALYFFGGRKHPLGAHYVTLCADANGYAAYNDRFDHYRDFLDMRNKTGARLLLIAPANQLTQEEQL